MSAKFWNWRPRPFRRRSAGLGEEFESARLGGLSQPLAADGVVGGSDAAWGLHATRLEVEVDDGVSVPVVLDEQNAPVGSLGCASVQKRSLV